MRRRNIKLVMEYDGTGFHGFQVQTQGTTSLRTVQSVLEESLYKLTGEEIRITGAGRTDAGVHALAQVANFHTASSIPADRFAPALNGLLPEDLVIKSSAEVDESFHAQRSAVSKVYRYTILNSAAPSALLRNTALHVPTRLDPGSMRLAAGILVGKHDFSSFRASGSSVATSVRTLKRLDVRWMPETGLLKLTAEADGFLYNMVRIIAGTLIEVGRGALSPHDVERILKARDRGSAGPTAPAKGLCLIEVKYEQNGCGVGNDGANDLDSGFLV